MASGIRHGRKARKGLALVKGKGDVYMRDNVARDASGADVAGIAREVRGGAGGVIDGQEQVGGCPEVQPVRRALDVPDDVDAWLERLAAEVEGR